MMDKHGVEVLTLAADKRMLCLFHKYELKAHTDSHKKKELEDFLFAVCFTAYNVYLEPHKWAVNPHTYISKFRLSALGAKPLCHSPIIITQHNNQ